MTSGKSEPVRRGRPPKGPMQGKGFNFATRVTAETRAALEAEAQRTGRSMSQVAELWLERGRILTNLGSAGGAIAEAQLQMLKAAERIGLQIGSPDHSIRARDELHAQWTKIAKSLFPAVVESAAVLAAEAQISALRYAAIDALDAVTEADPGGERLGSIWRRLGAISNAQLHVGTPDWPTAKAELVAAAKAEGGSVGECIEIVLGAMSAAGRAVARAESERK